MKIREEKNYIETGYCKGIQETLDKIIDICTYVNNVDTFILSIMKFFSNIL